MNEKITRGLGVGLVAAAALIVFAPALAASARPMMRRGMKAAVKAFVHGREAVAEFQEMAEDAYAEAWAELRSEAGATADTPKSDPESTAEAPREEVSGEPEKKSL